MDFSASTLTTLSFQSNAPIYHYIAGPIDLRIPDESDVETYDPPTTVEDEPMNSEEATFRSMIQSMLATNLTQVRTDGANIGYELVTITDQTNSNKVHYVLRHNGVVDNPHHWGTYIFNASPSYANEQLSVPHPVHDDFTARQGGYLYQELDLAGIQIAGNYRCSSSEASGCHGTTSVCSGSTDFRESDAAHSSEMPFHYASEEIADDNIFSHFVQLHGVTHVGGDPDVIVSNGTDQTPIHSDRVLYFVNYIDNNSSFNAVGVHSDPYTVKLTGYTNTFGRFLNAHQGNICSSNQIADNTTDRFMHVEQRSELREIESNYNLVRDAIIDFATTVLPLDLLSFDVNTIRGNHWLTWRTQNAHNVDRIEIEASKDGLIFEKVGEKMAINTEDVLDYNFRIESSSHLYYRLKIIDFDGHTEYSKVLMLPFSSKNPVGVFPSVTLGNCQVRAPEGTYVRVYDPMGRAVAQHCMEGAELTLEMAGLQPGMYLVDLLQGNERQQFKVILRR